MGDTVYNNIGTQGNTDCYFCTDSVHGVKEGGINATYAFSYQSCNTLNYSYWSFVSSSNTSEVHELPENVSISQYKLSITNVVADHEGEYTCITGNNANKIFNFTVAGKQLVS